MKRLRRLTAIITVWACVFGSLSLQGLREETSAMDTEFKNSVEATRDGSQINLTWAAKDNATAYEVMRSSGRYSEWTKVADVTDTSYSQEVDSVYKYYYKVVAKNGDETIETSNIAGMDIRNEYLTTKSLLRPQNNPAVIVEPDLEIPGRVARP